MTENNRNKIIINHYNGENFEEDERLFKDNSHKVEFITTTQYIDKYLKPGDKLLEIGAGTGAYSLHYAKQGYEVEAVDLSDRNVEIFKSKISKEMKINIRQMNALDLSTYSDNEFDITLLLGPLYHLFEEKDIHQAIQEAIRVTKPHGKIFTAYITKDGVTVRRGFQKGNIKDGFGTSIDKNYELINKPEEIFYVFSNSEFNTVMENFETKHLHSVATDGIAPLMAECVNAFDEEMYQHRINYHLKSCEQSDLLGFSSHMLYICEKK